MDSYSKTYENDIYFFLPMTATDEARFFEAMESLTPVEADATDFGSEYCRVLGEHVAYECNNPTFRTLERFYLGAFKLACYDDNYNGTVLDTEEAHLFVTAHRKTGLCIVTIGVHDNHYIPTQLVDQMSSGHLDVLDPKTGRYIGVADYMQSTFGLSLCGESKCVVCMSNKPEDELELAYILAGETYVSEHIDYHLNDSRIATLLENRACYDYYESYISRSAIAFVFQEYPEDVFERLDEEASVLFVVEIVLFQNTAVLRTNRRVVEELSDDADISNEEVEALYREFGRTMEFWSTDIFKYPFSQKEADEVIRSFGISQALEEYHRNQSFIDRLIDIKSTISEERASRRMDLILYALAWLEGLGVLLSGFLWLMQTVFGVGDITWWGILCVCTCITMSVSIYYNYVRKKK